MQSNYPSQAQTNYSKTQGHSSSSESLKPYTNGNGAINGIETNNGKRI